MFQIETNLQRYDIVIYDSRNCLTTADAMNLTLIQKWIVSFNCSLFYLASIQHYMVYTNCLFQIAIRHPIPIFIFGKQILTRPNILNHLNSYALDNATGYQVAQKSTHFRFHVTEKLGQLLEPILNCLVPRNNEERA